MEQWCLYVLNYDTLYDNVENYVKINAETKAIILGNNIVVDGFAKKPIRVVTHIHADHVIGINDSIVYSKEIVATPITNELVLELGYVKKSLIPLFLKRRVDYQYYQSGTYGENKLTLLPSSHIVGSAQVLVETSNLRIGYTSDFKIDEKMVIMDELDVLVIEATYGHPLLKRKFKNEAEMFILDLVNEGLKRYGRVVIYGYHGKLQEVMYMLRKNGIVEPFVMNRKIYNVTRIVEKYLGGIKNYYDSSTTIGYEIVRTGNYVLFEHFVKVKHRENKGGCINIILSGWEFREPVKRIDNNTWLVPFSSHGDFDDLIYYVEESNPKIIVVDGSRTGYPDVFAKILIDKGRKVIVLPK